MAKINIPKNFINKIKKIPISQARIGEFNSFHLSFGNLKFRGRSKIIKSGEFEIVTYFKLWRIVKHNNIICAKGDFDENNRHVFDNFKKYIEGSYIKSIEHSSRFDVVLKLHSEVIIEFIENNSDNDDDVINFYEFNKDKNKFI